MISAATCRYQFPNPELADPDGQGLIAFGGDLAADTLLSAYSQGLFPWFNEDEPIAWWSPDPRCIIHPNTFTPSKSLQRRIKHSPWNFTMNRAFAEVIHGCAATRAYANETWISPAMIEAYVELHKQGYAYSFEIWQDSDLIGGLYGLRIGQAFFGESMFHRVTDASKIAFFALMRICQTSQFLWVDCQLPNPHLLSLGATIISRKQFLASLADQITLPPCDWSELVECTIPVATLLVQDNMIYHNHRLTLIDANS